MAATAIKDIRQALATAIATAQTGLNSVTPAPPAVPTPPCAWVLRKTSARETNAFGTVLHTFIVRVVVALADDLASQASLDDFVDVDAIWAAIEADDTLGGIVETLYVTEAGADLAIVDRGQAATSQYLAADITVEVYAPGA